jgi:hypothetical protein
MPMTAAEFDALVKSDARSWGERLRDESEGREVGRR